MRAPRPPWSPEEDTAGFRGSKRHRAILSEKPRRREPNPEDLAGSVHAPRSAPLDLATQTSHLYTRRIHGGAPGGVSDDGCQPAVAPPTPCHALEETSATAPSRSHGDRWKTEAESDGRDAPVRITAIRVSRGEPSGSPSTFEIGPEPPSGATHQAWRHHSPACLPAAESAHGPGRRVRRSSLPQGFAGNKARLSRSP